MRTASTRFIRGLPGHTYKNGKRKRVLNPNAREHWRTKAAVKAYDRATVVEACRAAGLDGLRLQKAEVKFTLYYRTRRERDLDNAQALIKGALDGLTDSGAIADDRAAVIGQPVIEIRAPYAVEGYEITLTWELPDHDDARRTG